MSSASEIRLNREIRATPNRVFELISKGLLFTATGILPHSLKLDFTVGGKFFFEWVSGGFCEGEFTAIEEPRGIQFRWTTRASRHPAETATAVEVMLQPSRTGTALSLVHTGFCTP